MKGEGRREEDDGQEGIPEGLGHGEFWLDGEGRLVHVAGQVQRHGVRRGPVDDALQEGAQDDPAQPHVVPLAV